MEQIKIADSNEIIYKEKLDNGLEIYFYPNNNVKSFFLSLTTKYGSRQTCFKRGDEDTYHQIPNGVAHFLEHISFHLDGMEADDLFVQYGANINAFTSFDKTSYIVDCNNSFDKCLDNLLYYVYTPYFTSETVANEKGIIKEECKRSENDINRVFYMNKTKGLFSKSNIINKVVGELDEIESITLDDINNAYNTFYHPANMVLIITGNFDIDEAMKVINTRMNSFKFDKFAGIDVKNPNEPDKVNKEYQEIESDLMMNDKVSYSIKIPIKEALKTGLSLEEYDIYSSMILAANLDATSDYYRELLDKDIVRYSSSVTSGISDEFFIISIINSPKEGRVEEFIDITNKYVSNLKYDDKVVKRKIKCELSDYILSFDDNTSVYSFIISGVIYYGRVLDDYITILKSINEKNANKIIDSIDINNKSILYMKPKSE